MLTDFSPPSAPPDRDRVWLHIGLFLATFAAMVFAAGYGMLEDGLWYPLTGRIPFYEANGWTARVTDGLLYAVPFLFFLTVHEFGHYFAARWNKIRVSLPYYIPLPFALGTFGAVIRIKEPFRRTRQLFDVGASGPLAGFVAALVVIGIAVFTLPPVEYLMSAGRAGHAATIQFYLENGVFPERTSAPGMGVMLVPGDTPLFHAVMSLADYRVPSYELAHYPVLLAGWLGLFFTALNLLPVGQLDGGHVIYAMFGEAVHRVVARVTTLLLMLSGSVGWLVQMVPELQRWYGTQGLISGWAALAFVLLLYLRRYFGDVRYALVGTPVLVALAAAVTFLTPGLAANVGFIGWLLWSGLILFVIRMDHPPVLVVERLSPGRRALGWACIAIFLLCFSIQPLG
ncbi:hypothetical protein BSZ36_03630 [Rubricoccus marinus]|uniref:Peptidase M50 domain-containing protein n=1 Tax=Rubricoccus marinus TaxID=716817 RepID=A0A259U3P6_9BACT|nr:hypothetical protein BSZ36_03630 [Rubricoccus marinus]